MMNNLTDYLTDLPSGDYSPKNCIDKDGNVIQEGDSFTPGQDTCQVCTCFGGVPGLCQTVLCAPPSNCNSFRLKDRCCEWVCIDDEKTDSEIGLRLVACGVTAIFSVALLFFLIYRLRQRKMRDLAAAQTAAGANGNPDQGSIDSVAMTSLSGPVWMWWKPPENFVCQPPPPSYDDAVANDRVDGYRDDDQVSNSSGGSDAPSYDQIHRDAVLQTHFSTTRTPTPNPNLVGATLVLPQPAPPLSGLHHVQTVSYRHPSLTFEEEEISPRRLRTRNPSSPAGHSLSPGPEVHYGHRTLPIRRSASGVRDSSRYSVPHRLVGSASSATGGSVEV